MLAPHNAASLLSLPPARLWGGNIPLALPRVLSRQGSPPKSISPNGAASPTAAAAAASVASPAAAFAAAAFAPAAPVASPAASVYHAAWSLVGG